MSPLSRNPRDAAIQFHDSRRWGRCRASLQGRPLVITSTGLRSTGGSLSQGFRSVRSCSALLFGDRAARYVVMVWSGVDVLINFLRVVRGAGVSGVVIWSGVAASTQNWIVLAIVLIVMLGVYIYRIQTEEQMLLATNIEYAEYQKHTRKLIPFVY